MGTASNPLVHYMIRGYHLSAYKKKNGDIWVIWWYFIHNILEVLMISCRILGIRLHLIIVDNGRIEEPSRDSKTYPDDCLPAVEMCPEHDDNIYCGIIVRGEPMFLGFVGNPCPRIYNYIPTKVYISIC